MITSARLFDALDATWPAAAFTRQGPWLIRDGQGGGQRVSAATATDTTTTGDIEAAEQAMAKLGQNPLFQIRPNLDAALDRALKARGYAIRDEVRFYHIEAPKLMQEARVPVVHIWPPLAMTRSIWQEGGIGPARIDVMGRARGAKTALLARQNDRPAGAAFVAVDQEIAMIHAIEVPTYARRQGAAEDILRFAASWAQDKGAAHLALAVTTQNFAANALYAKLGMTSLGGYHYRVAQ